MLRKNDPAPNEAVIRPAPPPIAVNFSVLVGKIEPPRVDHVPVAVWSVDGEFHFRTAQATRRLGRTLPNAI